MEAWVLRTKDEPGLTNRVFGVAVGEHARERCVEEMYKYSEDAQKKMVVTGFVAWE